MDTIRLKTLATIPNFQRTQMGLNAQTLQYLMCAQSEFRSEASHLVVVGLGGLEPPASPLSGVRSNHLSYRPKVFPAGDRFRQAEVFAQGGGACRDRTDDPLLAKQVLSQLS